MELKNLTAAVNKYAKYVIQQSKTNLTKKDNKGGKLYESLSYKIEETSEDLLIEFMMEQYGVYQDKGVKGTDSNYIENKNSPFSYKSKGGKQGLKGMPPPKAFDKWTIKKGLAPRDKKGRFLPRKTLDFIIARSIFKKGIRATGFFSKPLNAGIKKYQQEFNQALGKDFDENQKKK